MQRVRIGLTGLACVFLLVLLAASVFGLIGRAPPAATGPAGGAIGNVAANSQEAPKEPLAELGVAPGNAPDHSVGNNMTAPTLSLAPGHASGSAQPAH